jgi:hypothetical protein
MAETCAVKNPSSHSRRTFHFIYTLALCATIPFLSHAETGSSESPILELSDFPQLKEFDSPETFERAIAGVIEECVTETAAGNSICFQLEAVWDRELNTAYQALISTIPENQHQLLRNGQRAWITERDRMFAFFDAVSLVMVESPDGEPFHGWMYPWMQSHYKDELKSEFIRQRALYLRDLRTKIQETVRFMEEDHAQP